MACRGFTFSPLVFLHSSSITVQSTKNNLVIWKLLFWATNIYKESNCHTNVGVRFNTYILSDIDSNWSFIGVDFTYVGDEPAK